MLSSREADQKAAVPCEKIARLGQELAEVKEENIKLKVEQLRAAAAAEVAEAARLARAHLAAAAIEKMEQELEMMRARLEQKSAQIKRLEDAREEAANGYRTPEKHNQQHLESSLPEGTLSAQDGTGDPGCSQRSAKR